MADFFIWLQRMFVSVRVPASTVRSVGQEVAPGGSPDQSAELAELRADFERVSDAVVDAERRLSEALAHQEDLSRELHHRVKNNLQIVISLLSLQARRIDDPAASKVLDQARVRIHAIALVHRLLYEEGETADINARMLTERLCRELHASFTVRPTIVLDCDADDFAMPIPVAMPFTLLIVELVSNALHYAFADGRAGRVKVLLRRHPGGAYLHIGDDGIGCASLPQETGSGIHLAHAFAGQLGAALCLTCQLDAGVQADVDMRWPAQMH